MPEVLIHAARFDELDTTTLYALLKLRVEVFVVEQRCPYPELDGRDLEPDTRHIWAEQAGTAHHPAVVGYLRVLEDPDGLLRVGRVCTAGACRGAGVADRLMLRALDEIAGNACRLDAQAYLVDFYRRYGFTPTGPEFLDDGIPHVPMTRPATVAQR